MTNSAPIALRYQNNRHFYCSFISVTEGIRADDVYARTVRGDPPVFVTFGRVLARCVSIRMKGIPSRHERDEISRIVDRRSR